MSPMRSSRCVVAVTALTACLAMAWGAEQDPVRLDACDEVVRLDLVFSCRIARDVASSDFARGPFIVQVSLDQAGRHLAGDEYRLARLGQLREGIQVALVPSSPSPSDQPVELHITLTNPQRTMIQRLDRELTTPLRLQRGLETVYRRIVAAAHDAVPPLPALWAEQADELMSTGESLRVCAQLVELEAQLSAWRPGDRSIATSASATLALRDPVDGSIQPLRLHLPDAPAPSALALVLGDPRRTHAKSAWPQLAEAWVAAARSAGSAVVETYPAGDTAWRGVGPRRALLALAAATDACPGLEHARVALVGIGTGAAGAILLAEREPARWSSLTLIDPVLAAPHGDEDPNAMHALALLAPGERPAHLVGLQIAVCGTPDAACAAWQRRVERAGGAVIAGFQSPDLPAFWTTIGKAVPLPVREYVAPVPGRYGPVEIEQLGAWGDVASLRILSWEPLRLSTFGIARLTPFSPSGAEIDGRPYQAVAAAPAPIKAAGQASGPLAGYADGPFVVVQGTGEHAAAAADNRGLAQAFIAAWQAHAQGRPPLVEDRAFRDQDFPRHHLVLIGNPRSNAVLRQLVEHDGAFPIHWDSHGFTALGQSFERNERRAVALAWPHPAHDGRLLVVLDGAPAWRGANAGDGPPLGGLPDLVVGGVRENDQPALLKLFDNHWR